MAWTRSIARQRSTGARAGAALASVLTILVLPSATFARDPQVTGTGIDDSVPGPATAEQLGYTDAYAQAKIAAFDVSVGLSRLSPGGFQAQSAPVSSSLGAWTTYHQKTNYNCLPAIGQSILHQGFGGYTFPTVAAMQGTAAQEPGTIAAGMHTTVNGTNDNNALAYVNSRYQAEGSPWRYLPTNNTVEADFKVRITNEIGSLGHALYVRVDLTSPYYAWHQSNPAQHATAAIAYTSSGTYTSIADPFTHSVTGGCSATWDSGAADVSCNWVNYLTDSYWRAKDIVRNGVQPMWF